MRQQACGGDALFDHQGQHRCLDQCFALAAGPLSTYMLLNGKHARCVIPLLADVFADALRLAPADTLGVLWFVTNDGAWELRRQRRALGLLARFVRRWGWTKRVQFSLDSLKVGVEQLIQQAASPG